MSDQISTGIASVLYCIVSIVALPSRIFHQNLANNNNNNNNNTLIYIAPACRMTSEALADSSSRATECLTEK